MSIDQTTPVRGQAPPPSPQPKPKRLTTIVVAVVVAIVLVGGGVAVAEVVNSGSSTTPNGSGPGAGQFRPGGGFAGRSGNGLSNALHGDFVASDGSGGYVTKRLQSGTVTAVSSTSITAKSADGYSTTFVVNSSTSVDNGINAIGDVKTGDTVTVVGTVSGGTATATTVFDTALNQNGVGS